MNLLKHWTRLTAILTMTFGVLLLIASMLVLTVGHAYQTSTGSIFSGVMLGATVAMIIMAARWLIRFRGQTDEEVATTQKQLYDERFMAAQGKAASVAVFVTVVFLVACSLIYQLKGETLVGWLFVIGALLAAVSRNLLTRLFLR